MLTQDEILTDYDEHYARPSPIKYDILRLSDEHRKFDGLIRRYWHDLHPLARDIFTSFANEFQYLINLAEEVENDKDTEINALRAELLDKLNEMNSNIETLQQTHLDEINDKDELFNELKLDFERLSQNLKSTIDKLDAMDLQNKEKTNLINLQKEEIENLRLKIDSKKSHDADTNEIISKSIANVNMFSSQLDLLEKEVKMIENEKYNSEKLVTSLQDKLETQKIEFETQMREKTSRYKILKESLQKIYISTERSKAENKAMKKLKIAQEQRLDSLESELNKLKEEGKKTKTLLDNQVKINKAYHSLTLKVIEIADKGTSKRAKIVVPDLLSQLNKDNSESRPEEIDSNSSDKRGKTVKNDPDAITAKILGKMVENISEKKKENHFKKKMDNLVKDKKRVNKRPPLAPDINVKEQRVVDTILEKLDKSDQEIKEIMKGLPAAPKSKKKKGTRDGKQLA